MGAKADVRESAQLLGIIPRGKKRLYQALIDAGVSGARPLRNVSWFSHADDGTTVLNLWRRYLRVKSGRVVAELDARTWAKHGISPHKTRALLQELSRKLSEKIRVVILEESEAGSRRSVGAMCDGAMWKVTESGGDFVLRRESTAAHEEMQGSAREFTTRMLKIYEDAKSQIGYQANRFRQKVARDGGVVAAKYWLRPTADTTDGFRRLSDHDRLDLSVEAVVLDPQWRHFFTPAELRAARSRLDEVGFFGRVPLPKARTVEFGADEIDPLMTFPEGLRTTIQINAYERDPKARQSCIQHYGAKCYICEFDFAAVYGELGAGYIHVHHLLQLAMINGQVLTNPIRDLRPVCPNCHSMLHRQSPPITIGELKRRIAEKRRR
jgi:5-methylcytosine-specific restriction protein A